MDRWEWKTDKTFLGRFQSNQQLKTLNSFDSLEGLFIIGNFCRYDILLKWEYVR